MKFTNALVGLFAASVAAAPIEAEVEASEPALITRNPGGINYVQNYNGKPTRWQILS